MHVTVGMQQTLAVTGAILTLALGMDALAASGVNPVPQAQSFESVAVGAAIQTLPGWSQSLPSAIVTNDPTVLAALAAYTNAGGLLPLATTHEKVLSLDGVVSQRVAGPTQRVTRSDMLLYPERRKSPNWREDVPTPDPPIHAGICFETNGQPVVYHFNEALGSNEWLTLSQAAPVASQSWCRVTVVKDYVNRLFALRIDDSAFIEDAAGLSGPPPGGTSPGPWFRMAVTNAEALSEVVFINIRSGSAFLDDLEIVGELPEVLTLPATNVTAATANLPGYLTFTGLAQTAVGVYYGPSDGGTNVDGWATSNYWAAPQTPGEYVYPLAVSTGNVVHYRFAAANSYGQYWAAESKVVVVGDVRMDLSADNGAVERPLETGSFRIERPAWATNVDLVVYYTMSGTASNGVDYEYLPGHVTIPAGSLSVEVTLMPIADGVLESDETAIMQLIPGPYLTGSPSSATVTIVSAQPQEPLWRNLSGDMNWNSTSENWEFSDDFRFYTLDLVTFNDGGSTVTGRIYVGTATRVPGGGWTNATPATVRPGAITISSGQFEFEGGGVEGAPAVLTGGRVIDRRLATATFGTDPLTLSGGAEFWRQVPPDTAAITQVFSNAVRVAGAGGTLQGGRGQNEWVGAVDLRARLNLGTVTPVVAHVNRLAGTLAIDQDTNNILPRVVALRSGGGQVYLDGPIVDDPDTNHTGNFPLWLESQAGTAALTLRGANTYAYGTVITNVGGTNGVVVEAGSSLGTGPVTLAGSGARLTVRAAGALQHPLTIPTNATVVLAVDGAVTLSGSPLTVQNGGLLWLQSGDCLPDLGVLQLGQSGRVQIATNLVERIEQLYIGGFSQRGGLYTRAELPANILGDGALLVRGPTPAGLMLLVR